METDEERVPTPRSSQGPATVSPDSPSVAASGTRKQTTQTDQPSDLHGGLGDDQFARAVPRETRRRGREGVIPKIRLPVVAEGIGMFTAVAALGLSTINWVSLNGDPEITMSMPRVLRVSQHTDGYTLTLQPTFTVLDNNEHTSFVSGVRLDVEPVAGVSPKFYWVDVARFVHDQTTGLPVWRYSADPAPISVTWSQPSSDFLRFVSVDPLAPGTWTMRLSAEHLASEPLQATFCVTLTRAEVTWLRRNPGYHVMRNDYPSGAGDERGSADCYRFGRFGETS